MKRIGVVLLTATAVLFVVAMTIGVLRMQFVRETARRLGDQQGRAEAEATSEREEAKP